MRGVQRLFGNDYTGSPGVPGHMKRRGARRWEGPRSAAGGAAAAVGPGSAGLHAEEASVKRSRLVNRRKRLRKPLTGIER